MPVPHHSSFLQAGCPSCCPTNSVKALKAEKKPLTGVIVVVGLMVCFNRGDKYHEFYFIQIQSLIQYLGGYLCHYTIEHTDLVNKTAAVQCSMVLCVVSGLLAMSTMNSYFYGAVVTIIAVHVFLAIFIYTAVNDSAKPATRKAD